MVEEDFEFYCSEMLQNEGFLLIVREYFHHGRRKFEFYCSEMLQNEGFVLIVREYFHHG